MKIHYGALLLTFLIISIPIFCAFVGYLIAKLFIFIEDMVNEIKG